MTALRTPFIPRADERRDKRAAVASMHASGRVPAEWSPQTNFVEIDVRDRSVMNGLASLGYSNYLGVSRSQTLAARLQSEAADAQAAFVATNERRWILYNNAEVLVLSGRSILSLWSYRNVRHAQHVAWKASLRPIALLAMLGWLIRFIAGQYEKPVRLCFRATSGEPRVYLVSRVRRRRRCYHDALHFIPQRLGLAGMLRAFHDNGVNYAILRWFESLPKCLPTGDVDFLIDDNDLQRVLALLQSGPGIHPCDLYTPSGLPQSSYLTVSYYPPTLARRLLSNARMHGGFCRVPSEEDYFHSLAYHAVYHKGPDSNLPGSAEFQRRRKPSRDFTALLREKATRLGVNAEISLAGLHHYLSESQWAPSPDLIVRLAAGDPRNRWLQSLAAAAATHPAIVEGLATFIIRQSAVDAGVHERMIALIEQHGFKLLARKTLTAMEIEHGSLRTRGGNWGPGPGDHEGGLPAILVAAYDPNPVRPTRSQRKRFPLVTNARTLAKEAIRRRVNAEIAPRRAINGLHSSDHAAEAHYFLQVFAPELLPRIRKRIADENGEQLRRPLAA